MNKSPKTLYVFPSLEARMEWEHSFYAYVGIGDDGHVEIDGLLDSDDLRKIADKVDEIKQAKLDHLKKLRGAIPHEGSTL